jgi:hypothetical protein
MENTEQQKPSSFIKPRSKQYIIYLVLFMGIVAIMDQYLSMVPITYMNSILDEYAISASQFSWWEALYLIPTFFIFALNGLVDIIGRKFFITSNCTLHTNISFLHDLLFHCYIYHGIKHVGDSN